MRTQHGLMSLPPRDWGIDKVVVFDWYDGPRQGVARMSRPECEFAFELLAERHNPNDMDDRLFRVSDLPVGSVAKIQGVIHLLNAANENERLRAKQEIGGILNEQKRTNLVIYTRDMAVFLGCWQDDRGSSQVKDWFSTLGI